MPNELKLPSQSVTETALLLYLWEVGEAIPRDVYPVLADMFGLSTQQRTATRSDNSTPRWNNRVQWARKALKDKGLITDDLRIWRLSAGGANRANDAVLASANETEFAAIEGGVRLREHLERERSSALIALFKETLNTFECEACNFDFEAFYGPLGSGFIEAHHRVPLASTQNQRTSTLSDLAALCANCHRIIHRNLDMSVTDLRDHLRMRHSI